MISASLKRRSCAARSPASLAIKVQNGAEGRPDDLVTELLAADHLVIAIPSRSRPAFPSGYFRHLFSTDFLPSR
jgi:hypothetical protein